MEMAMTPFDPMEQPARCEQYVSRFLGGSVQLVGAQMLARSTRDAPWRLDVKVDGVARSLVLRLESWQIEHEYRILRALESLSIPMRVQALRVPTPRAWGWDPAGEALGIRCFFYEFVEGESLLGYMLAGEAWAEDLYIETAYALQSITREQLASVADLLGDGESAADVLEDACAYFRTNPQPLADAACARLRETMPRLPEPRFGNGDLWPDNLIIRDGQLAGVIDWAQAGFSDPIFEFLLPFFLRPELRGRGIEERYCRRMRFDPGLLSWYHGLEFIDSWHWVLAIGEPYEQHTSESLQADLARWLEEC
jgi:aminoglycoside phosphotransferase (APT) family kinase protein